MSNATREWVRGVAASLLGATMLFSTVSDAAGAAAQSASGPPPLRIKAPGWRLFGTWRQAQGLPQDTIYQVIQGRDGYLWMGTKAGLVRFDGVQFRTFDASDPAQLRDNEVWSVAEAADGSIWAGTFGGGVSRYDRGRFTVYTSEQGLLSDYVSVVCAAPDGSVWFGTDRGASRFKDGTFTSFGEADGLPSPVIRGIWVEADGTVWLGTNAGGVARYRDGRLEKMAFAGDTLKSEVRGFWRDPEGALWIGTYEGLGREKDGRVTLYTAEHGLSSARMRQIGPDAKGALWVVTDNGLDRMTWRDGAPSFERILPSLEVSGVCFDHEGSIWVGSFIEGLSRIREGIFTTYTPDDGVPHYYASSVLQDRSGTVWVGTRSGLARFRDGQFTPYDEASGLPKATVFALLEDRAGHLWVGTSSGLFRSASAVSCVGAGCRLRFTPRVIPSISRQYIRALFEDRAGDLWVALDQDGVARLRGEDSTVFTVKDGLGNNSVRVLGQTSDGALWVGTRGGGLSRYHEDRFQTFRARDGLAGDGVQALLVDADDTLWIGTRQGLGRYRDGRFRSYTVKDGLFDNYIYSFVDDGGGYLWMGTAKGVFRVSRQDLDDVAAGRKTAVRSEVYGLEHGFRSTLAVVGGAPVSYRSHDGKLWFATMVGVTVADPARLAPNVRPPAVHIEVMEIDSKRYAVTDLAQAPAGRGDVAFRFTALSFLAPEKMRFRYRLEGYDPDWKDTDARRVEYTNIPPGDYTFRVVASNNEGVWNEEGARVQLSLAPHFHQTRWFYGLCVLGIAMLGAGTQRLRVRALQQRERELSVRVEEALAQVKSLRGLLPICASCKKIRDDKGYWNQMEVYIQEHSEADFSHGICPDCMERLYPDYMQRRSSGTDG